MVAASKGCAQWGLPGPSVTGDVSLLGRDVQCQVLWAGPLRPVQTPRGSPSAMLPAPAQPCPQRWLLSAAPLSRCDLWPRQHTWGH